MTATPEEKAQMEDMSQRFAAMQAQIKALEAKLAKLEAVGAPAPVPDAAAQMAPPAETAVPSPSPAAVLTPSHEEISEEVMLVIAAAVAAYLGERAHIRVVRLVPTGAWAQQGRVSIQASHRLN